ncbi:N-acetylmuramoyl-L-alanine amidase [Volucribacter psittacicida]|uniref:N-acetylmuramoyl-L-alanine amidase n=1 Tax=Volucribacter psittacicida TaxID=203482 RepID=A0A4R1G2T8_9PAST|nr:N-acetylmuramoyl-L-alanine amidase [Volucribacter psittacicida]
MMLNTNFPKLTLKKYCTFWFFFIAVWLLIPDAMAGTLTNIQVKHSNQQSQVQFQFNSKTQYRYFYLTDPHRLVIDFPNSQAPNRLFPYAINNGAVKAVRLNNPPRPNTLRVVIDLSRKTAATFSTQGNNIVVNLPNPQVVLTNANNPKSTNNATSKARVQRAPVWTIAIDPGHGGKDPGAIGRNLKIYEKNVTLSIARELKALLDADPNFRGVLTRNGDYYISVPERSEIARKNKANYLVSIHADSSVSPNLRGASVWVLSNRRANSEMGRWLEDHEKQSELLGGAGDVLSNNKEKYLNQTVLDLQFGHSQRAGYELGSIVLRHFANITTLSKGTPQHASLGVLRSPDIPSILVETGFLSNAEEEKKLNTLAYRKRVARIIYNGLVEYRKKNIQAEMLPEPKSPQTASNNSNVIASGTVHTVTKGETLLGLANRYKVKSNDIVSLNNLTSRNLLIGQKLKIPAQNNATTQGSTSQSSSSAVKNNKNIPKTLVIKPGQTLSAVSREYGIPLKTLLALNPNLKNGRVQAGQTIKLREK